MINLSDFNERPYVGAPAEFEIHIQDFNGTHQHLSLHTDQISIGRHPNNTIILNERNISREHARITRQDNGIIFIEDLKSYNGVLINGERIQHQKKLQANDILQIGDFQLTLQGPAFTINPSSHEITHTDIRPIPQQPENTAATSQDDPKTAIIRLPNLTTNHHEQQNPIQQYPEPAHLVGKSQHVLNQIFSLQHDSIIGRTPDNDIVIDHRSISKQHAKIFYRNQQFVLMDLASANGTRVNGETYAEIELKSGDIIELGHLQFQFYPPNIPIPQKFDHISLKNTAPTSTAITGLFKYATFMGLAVLFGAVAYKTFYAQTNPPTTPQASATQTPEYSEPVQLMVQAQAAAQTQNWTKALTLSQAALVLDEQNTDAKILVEKATLEQKAQAALEEAKRLMVRKHWPECWNSLQEIPTESMYHPEAMQLSQQAKIQLIQDRIANAKEAIADKHIEDAEAFIEEAAGFSPNDPEILALRQQLKMQQHANTSTTTPIPTATPNNTAQKTTTETPSAKPKIDPRSLYVEASDALFHNKLQYAIQLFEQCIQTDPHFALCYRALGVSYARANNAQQAAHYYQLYLEQDPNARDATQVRQILEQYQKERPAAQP